MPNRLWEFLFGYFVYLKYFKNNANTKPIKIITLGGSTTDPYGLKYSSKGGTWPELLGKNLFENNKDSNKKEINDILGTENTSNTPEYNIKKIKEKFENSEKQITGTIEHFLDKESFVNHVAYWTSKTSNDYVSLTCYDWSNKSGYSDQLRVETYSNEYYIWLSSLEKN